MYVCTCMCTSKPTATLNASSVMFIRQREVLEVLGNPRNEEKEKKRGEKETARMGRQRAAGIRGLYTLAHA